MNVLMINPKLIQSIPNEHNPAYRVLRFIDRDNVIEISIDRHHAKNVVWFLSQFIEKGEEDG